jgi:hypothetical protein
MMTSSHSWKVRLPMTDELREIKIKMVKEMRRKLDRVYSADTYSVQVPSSFALVECLSLLNGLVGLLEEEFGLFKEQA